MAAPGPVPWADARIALPPSHAPFSTKHYTTSALCAAGGRVTFPRDFKQTSAPPIAPPQVPATLVAPPSYPRLDERTRNTWEYPASEAYPDREYQLEIAAAALFQNTLVALPTGLGKTHIAAVVMYNFYRWFPRGQVVFLAPTRPLVTQQIEACYHIVGIPVADTAQMCGSTGTEKRVGWWSERRVFFCTPQTFGNDVRAGRVDASRIVLVVVDEAHRASKNHAFVTCIQALDARRARYRVLALSATPGTDLNRVQAVVRALHISRIEVRVLDDPSIAKYRRETTVDKVCVPLSPALEALRAEFSAVVDSLVKFLIKAGAIRSPLSSGKLSQMQLLQLREAFVASRTEHGGGASELTDAVYRFACGTFTLLLQLAPAQRELMTHGTRAFHQSLLGINAAASAPGVPPGCARHALVNREPWKALLARLNRMEETGTHAVHPKLVALGQVLEEHFARKLAAGQPTRAIVFTETRGSVDEILR
jgi:ERCC4-related helicase